MIKMKCLFQAYGISVSYPSEWRIYIPQNQSFSMDDGILKFDDIGGADSRASFTLSWEKTAPVTGFAGGYLESAEKNYAKKVKGRCRILEKERTEINGHEAGFMRAQLLSSTHVFNAMGKSLELEVMQAAFYCPDSGRIVMGTMIAKQDYFEKNRECLREMVMGIQCHTSEENEVKCSGRSEEHAYSEVGCAIQD